MGKNKGRISKRIQQSASKRGLKSMWIDGCYLEHEGALRGGAAVLCDTQDKIEHVVCFPLNHIPVDGNDLSELWTLGYALDSQPADSIGQLYFDNPYVDGVMRRARTNRPLKASIPPDLQHLLLRGIAAQPHMNPNAVTRSIGRIGVADHFAKAIAGSRKFDLGAVSRRFGSVPYTVLDIE